MVGVASSAILGRGGLPAAVTSTSTSSSFSSSSHFAAATLFVAFALLPIASEGHPCVPLYRVTFGLRAQPNLPGGRPGPPFSTNPGNELRGSRGLLVAMATEPSPNPLNQTPIPYPSALRYPFLVARVVRAAVLVAKESLSISSCVSLFDGFLLYLLVLFYLLFFAPPSPFLYSLCFIQLNISLRFFLEFVLLFLFFFIYIFHHNSFFSFLVDIFFFFSIFEFYCSF